MSAFITAIGTANPSNRYSQGDIAQFMCDHLPMSDGDKRKLKVLYRATGIQFRHSVLDDYKKRLGSFSFYANTENLEPFPSTRKRMMIYKEKAATLGISAITNCLNGDHKFSKFTHLITVSCTGMYAPGLDVDIIKALNLDPSINRNSLNFMGCYAAMNALNLAKQICDGNKQAKVLIVSVELCTLHLQKEPTEDNVLSQSLFGDGAAAVVVSPQPGEGASLEILSSESHLYITGKNDMAWHIGDYGFQMALTAYVPKIIESGIKELTNNLFEKSKFTLADIDEFAIHPGGKGILESIEKELGLTKEQNKLAYDVLKEYGNMSSPTILFVLKKTLEKLDGAKGKKVLSFAFGPGLTMESILFQSV